MRLIHTFSLREIERLMNTPRRCFALSALISYPRKPKWQPTPSFIENYDVDRKDIPKRITQTDTMQRIAELPTMSFEIEEEEPSEKEKRLLASGGASPISAEQAVSAHMSAVDSKSLMIHQLHEQRAARREQEACAHAPVELEPAEILRDAEKRFDENVHESTLLKSGHKELTLKLKLLYHKLHCANMISLNILNKREKSMYQVDRQIELLTKRLKRMRAIRMDHERRAKASSRALVSK